MSVMMKMMKAIMMRVMAWRSGVRMVSCEDALERLFEYLDGELDDVSNEEVGEHFRICRECYPKLQFEKSFLDALHAVRSGHEAPADVKARVIDALKKEGFTPS